MNTSTKIIIGAGGLLIVYMLMNKSNTGSLLSMPKTTSSTSSIWNNAGSFFGSTFKSWFGSDSSGDGYTPDVSRPYGSTDLSSES